MSSKQFFNQSYRWVFLLGSSSLAACHSLPTARSAPEQIFRRGRKLVYQAAHQAPGSSRVRLDTLAITCLDKYKPSQPEVPANFKADTTQRELGWSYSATAAPNAFSGVLENDTVLWSHPPRDGDYAVLELSPYPYIKLPAITGRQWQWDLIVGDSWSRRWATWQGLITVSSYYRTVGQRTLDSHFGPLTCWLVEANSTCPKGTSTLETWYHPTYGFVRLRYRTIDGGHLTLTLIKDYDNVLQAEAYLPHSLQLRPN